MALSLAMVAVAGVLLAIRANFDPSTGPTRLIFGFEAVIIGGLGSLWGTLAGGDHPRRRAVARRAMDPGFQILAGHLAFLPVLALRPGGTLREQDMTSAISASPAFPLDQRVVDRRRMWGCGAGLSAGSGFERCDGLLIDIFLYVALACLWNFLAVTRNFVSVGQQAFVGLGGYGLFALATKAGLPPLLCVPIVESSPQLYRSDRETAVSSAGRLLRHQFLGRGGGIPALGHPDHAARRRLGHGLPARIAQSIGRAPHDRYVAVYLTTLGLLLGILVSIFLVLRSRTGLALTGIRDNELAALATGSMSIARNSSSTSSRLRHRHDRRAHLLQRLRISPDAAFSVNDWTPLVIFMVVIGGLGSFEGPILGALVYFLLRETLSNLGPLDLTVLALGRDCCNARRTSRISWTESVRAGEYKLLPLQLVVVPPQLRQLIVEPRDRPFCAARFPRPQRVRAERAGPGVEIFRPEQHRHAVVIGVIHADTPETMTVQDTISSFVAGSIQRSQSPAKARIGEPSAAVNRCGCLSPFSPVHSKKPDAGMMQRRRLNKSRNIGFSATVSARALNVAGSSFRLFFQKNGKRPQRIETSSRRPSAIEADHIDIHRRRDVVARA